LSQRRLLIPAAIGVVAVLIAAVLAARALLSDDGKAPYRLDVALAETTRENRLLPASAACPAGGRLAAGQNAPLPNANFTSSGGRTTSALVAPGQLVAFEFLLSAANDAPGGSIGFQAAWDRGDQRGAGFDPNQKVVCAFVDPTDPSARQSDAAATSAKVTWNDLPPTQDEIRANFAVEGVAAGDEIVVEVWLVAKATLPSISDTLRAQLVSADADQEVSFVRDSLAFRLDYFDRAEQPTLELNVDDSPRQGVNRAEQVDYTITVTNPSQTSVAPVAQIDDFLDKATTLIGDVGITDTEGSPTTCNGTADGFTCALGFVNPGEKVVLTVAVAVQPNAERRNTKEDEGCTDLVDICNQTVLSWKQSDTANGRVKIDQPSDIPTEKALTISRYLNAQAPYAYPGQRVTVTYAVSNAAAGGFNQLKVTDTACPLVELKAGDANANGRLDPGESWRYECTIDRMDPEHAVSDARVEALADDGRPVADTAVTQITLISPKLRLVIANDQEDPTMRRLSVGNVGDAIFSEPAVTAANCSAATLASGDKGNDRRMEPGETWVFTCKAERPDQPVQARAYALDPLGQAATAIPDAQ
jgi:uncharacterized repeat protein (TIGR01451 family)